MRALTISQLYIHPVKSLAGITVNCFNLDSTGPEYDRRWMVVNTDGKFVTQRQHPKMCLIKTQIDNGVLTLSADGLDSCEVLATSGEPMMVEVWHDQVLAQDCGDEVSDWLSQILKVSVRLVYMPKQTRRLVDQDYADENQIVGFADGFPLLIVSQASLDLLNTKLDDVIDMQRFRPNIVVDGCKSHAEDDWQQLEIAGNTVQLVKLCSRCIIPSIDPLTAQKQAQIIAVLNKYRRQAGKIYFGKNAVVENGTEPLSVGDTVTVVS